MPLALERRSAGGDGPPQAAPPDRWSPARGGPLIVGHRGAAGLAPENTLCALRAGLEAGADWIECDVRFSADGVPVLIHDATLDRTTGGRGAVSDAPFARIAALDAGSWRDPRFRGERVPSLRAALEMVASPERGAGSAGLNIEIKDAGADPRAGIGKILAEVRAAGLARFLVSSFDREVVALAAAEGAPIGVLPRRSARFEPGAWRRAGARAAILSTRQATEGAIRGARACGLAVWVYTVNSRRTFERLARAGCEAIIGDRPDLLRAWRDAT